MHSRTLGRELQVSAVGLGCMGMSQSYGPNPGDRDDMIGVLRSALDLVRPGGVVVYATCSPVLAETRDVVAAILAEDPAVSLEPAAGAIAGVPDAAGPLPGTVQLWPHRHGTDAMFVAVLRRAGGAAGERR